MTREDVGPGPPSEAHVRRVAAAGARSLLSCGGLGLLGLAQALGLAFLLVALLRGASGEEGWLGPAALGAALLIGGLVSFLKVYRSLPETPAGDDSAAPRAASPEELAAAHPEEPWRWNEEWASGRLSSRLGATVTLFAAAATVATAIALPAAVAIWRSAPPDLATWREDPGGLALAALPSLACLLPGLLLGGLALRLWLVRWRFGSPVLEMRAVPAEIGGRLEGTVITALRRRPKAVRLRLACTRLRRRRVQRRRRRGLVTIDRSELWSAEREVPVADLFPGPRGLAVPVAFEIPSSCPSTVWHRRLEGDARERVSWTLHLHAPVLGVDLEASWLVPVFEVGSTPAEREDPHVHATDSAGPAA